jgi:rubrerythrin
MITGKEDLLQSLIEVFIMEKGTKLFYSEAAGKATTPNVRKTFDELSHWEETHMDYIQYLYQSVNGDQEIMSFNEFRNRVGATITEGGIPVKALDSKMGKYIVENEKGALTLAMEIEGKAFNLYRKLSLHSEDANAKVLFEEMMDQEVKHINYLKELKIKLADANR